MFNKDKNEKLYIKTLKKGNAEKQYALARKFIENRNEKDFMRACDLYEAAANSGHKDAPFELGKIYYSKNVRERDWGKAARWFEKAAERGVTEAYKILGGLYRFGGYGATEDPEKAIENYLKYYEVCGEDQKAEIENNLGSCYFCIKDEENALRWARRCAKHGGGDALCSLGAMLYDYKRYDEALDILTRAVDAGDTYAYCLLGECYLYGNGTAKDMNKAKELLQKAAQDNIEDADELLKKHFGDK